MSGLSIPARMSEYTTISLRKEFVNDVEQYIEDEPFGSVKEFVKHVVVREMESDSEISETEARQIGQKLRELGYME
jgi:Arc/MetJ-type ribon-helix-helix transcriptional regulator